MTELIWEGKYKDGKHEDEQLATIKEQFIMQAVIAKSNRDPKFE